MVCITKLKSNLILVVHSTHYFIKETCLMDFQDNVDYLALIFSALCHDVNHTGKNNTYEMNTFSKLAIKYNDKSVLEQHHSAVTF